MAISFPERILEETLRFVERHRLAGARAGRYRYSSVVDQPTLYPRRHVSNVVPPAIFGADWARVAGSSAERGWLAIRRLSRVSLLEVRDATNFIERPMGLRCGPGSEIASRHPRLFYNTCDRLGLLAWIEPPIYCYHPGDAETGTRFADPAWLAVAQNMAREMIATACNHPSVAIYGIGNECNAALEAIDLTEMRKMLDTIVAGKPNLALFLTEFGADSVSGFHARGRDLWSEEYHHDLLRVVLALASEYPRIVGVFPFCFSDYRDPSKVHNGYWNRLNLKGGGGLRPPPEVGL